MESILQDYARTTVEEMDRLAQQAVERALSRKFIKRLNRQAAAEAERKETDNE